jgi:hypothetical protein
MQVLHLHLFLKNLNQIAKMEKPVFRHRERSLETAFLGSTEEEGRAFLDYLADMTRAIYAERVQTNFYPISLGAERMYDTMSEEERGKCLCFLLAKAFDNDISFLDRKVDGLFKK